MNTAFLQQVAGLKPPRRSRRANILLALVLVGCSSSTIETFGCACARWSVTHEQLDEWRKRAPQGDIDALLGLRTYADWKVTETAEGTSSRRYWEAELALATQHLIDVGDLPIIWRKVEDDIWSIGGSTFGDDPDRLVDAEVRSMPHLERLAAYDAALDRLDQAIRRETALVRQRVTHRPLSDWMGTRIVDGIATELHSDPTADLQAYRRNRNALARRWGLPERRF